MVSRENDSCLEERSISESSNVFYIPIWVRAPLTILLVSMIVSCIIIFVSTVLKGGVASPSDLELSNLLIYLCTLLILIVMPWKKFGLQIKKIGLIEFENVISVQKEEQADIDSEILKRIERLENEYLYRKLSFESKENPDTIGSHVNEKNVELLYTNQNHQLSELLLLFFNKFNHTWFSSTRIKNWGSKQDGIEKLANYQITQIRVELQKMVSKDQLKTKVSDKGNTLYKIR